MILKASYTPVDYLNSQKKIAIDVLCSTIKIMLHELILMSYLVS